jgi:hypothetical protein
MRALPLAVCAIAVATGAARADRPNVGGAKMAASAWMNAAAKTPQALDDAVALTGLPFWYEGAIYLDRGSSKSCAKVGARGTATDATAARVVLDCLRHGTQPLLDAVDAWTEADLAALPAPLARFHARLAELAKTHTLILAHAKAKKTEDWAVLAVRADPVAGAAFVSAYVAAHRGR